MPTSEARKIANRMNSAKSTGPKTPEGKERSRANGLKHGLTGRGIVVAEVDRDQVDRRFEALDAELGPKSVLGGIMVREMATLSVRMERSAKQEEAAIAVRVRHAGDAFDEARLDEADRLLDAIGEDPRFCLRKLLKSPEGGDRLIVAWQELRLDLTRDPRPLWTAWQFERAANLAGLRVDDAQGSRIGVLSRAIRGDFAALADSEGGDLDDEGRKAWARGRMVERIDEEIAGLEEHYETLDFETIDLDRAESGARALFDPSKEATLARRYESEARRGFFKALKQFHQAEAEAAERAELAPEPAPRPAPEVARPRDPLASSWEGPSRAVRDPQPASPRPSTPQDRPSIDRDGQPLIVARPSSMGG